MDHYEDIISLPHHISKKHPRMSTLDRAAQFSPFAALTGYEDAIEETGGAYISVSGRLKKIDFYSQTIILTDGTTLSMSDITAIESDVLTEMFDL